MKISFALVALVVVVAGCTPRVVEFDVAVGERMDTATGYYAYFSNLAPTDPGEISVELASRAAISGMRRILGETTREAFPVVAYEPRRTYAVPESLMKSIEASVQSETDSAQLEIGYFMYRVPGGTSEFESGVALLVESAWSPAGGLRWAEPTAEMIESLRVVLPEMIAVAASQGADTIGSLAVFHVAARTAWGGAGVYITGHALATGLDPDSPRWTPGVSARK